ncbi:MAG: capsule biosynthesis protein, partial [Planktomarina sp.]
TIIAAWYFYTIASPLYSTHSSFLIQQNEEPAATGGGLFGAGVVDAVKDSIAVQGYLTSMGAMIRLEEDQGFKSFYSADTVDSLSRLATDASDADAFKVYRRSVKIGFDPTEGIINMEVIAPTPQASYDFSIALLRYAEEQVSDLTQRKRADQMKGAQESFRDAEEARTAALLNLVKIQQDLQVIDPMSDAGSVMGQINALETEKITAQLALEEQLANLRPNRVKVEQLRAAIKRREDLIAELRRGLTEGLDGQTSIASKTAQLRIAEADFATRDLMLQTALQALEGARVSADRQARYVAPSIEPVLSDAPSYPRKFENTMLAFLIFGGIYLIMSLTASILREQV